MIDQSHPHRLRVFIGCTTEARKVAEAVQANLAEWCYPEIWDQGFFLPARTIIDSLEERLPAFDLAVFVLTGDDIAVIRQRKYRVARDNLLLEVGLSIGALGGLNTFMILPDDSNVRLPTDLLGVKYTTYASNAPNLHASLAPACVKIRDTMKSALLRPLSIASRLFAQSAARIHPSHTGEFHSLAQVVRSLVFDSGVLRRNWTIDLAYRVLAPDLIAETIIWDYEFLNITKDPIKHPFSLFYLAGDTENQLISFTKTTSGNRRTPVFSDKDTQDEKKGIFLKRQSVLDLEPGISHFITLRFVLNHSVSPRTHRLHNSLAPIDPTLSARLKARVPQGYTFDLLAREAIEPEKQDDHWDFHIPGPLLPEQIIEYIFQKTPIP